MTITLSIGGVVVMKTSSIRSSRLRSNKRTMAAMRIYEDEFARNPRASAGVIVIHETIIRARVAQGIQNARLTNC